jgi:hypothetical protein
MICSSAAGLGLSGLSLSFIQQFRVHSESDSDNFIRAVHRTSVPSVDDDIGDRDFSGHANLERISVLAECEA